MFDRLIVSEPDETGGRSRRNYFLVSAAVVGVLAVTAVVFSIFAEDISLGTDSFALTSLIVPVDMPPARPEPPRPRAPATTTPSASANQMPSRKVNMAPVDEPTKVPATTSTAPNTELSRPRYSPFVISDRDTGPSGVSRDTGPTSAGPGGGLSIQPQVAENKREIVEPPPARVPPRKETVVTRGVVNGQASYLPKPAYPAPALAVRAQGKVDVQVLIDEAGHVISAKAVSGNILFRDAAERAARNARFSPTTLSDVPVKVTGVIVFNFTLG